MSKKQPHVPETRERHAANRELRRHPERAEDEPLARDREGPDLHAPQDVASTRAKASGHGKKTADKWNQ